ncbi:MAG: hypothetical protein HC846_13520 [Blastocatellia bacterium]|nr:hypothetical protein [Blastocatellia bacterium]
MSPKAEAFEMILRDFFTIAARRFDRQLKAFCLKDGERDTRSGFSNNG